MNGSLAGSALPAYDTATMSHACVGSRFTNVLENFQLLNQRSKLGPEKNIPSIENMLLFFSQSVIVATRQVAVTDLFHARREMRGRIMTWNCRRC
jgi:hypothetical protein